MNMKMNPDNVAFYAAKDSRALSKVNTDDLLEELTIRGTEYATLPKVELIAKLQTLAKELQDVYEESIGD